MKWGALLVGALAGAAVVLAVGRSDTASAVAASMGRSMKRRMLGMNTGAFARTAGAKLGGSLDEVRKWVAQDPSVAKEVEAIIGHNGH